MTGTTADCITLEFEPGEPIHGTLHDQAGRVHEFRGWLELCAALERAWQQDASRRERLHETARTERGY